MTKRIACPGATSATWTASSRGCRRFARRSGSTRGCRRPGTASASRSSRCASCRRHSRPCRRWCGSTAATRAPGWPLPPRSASGAFFDKAAQAFEQAVRLRPRDAAAWYALGSVRVQAGATEPAVSAFRRAVELDPDLAEAWHSLGVALAFPGPEGRVLPEDALAAFRQAVRLRPDLAEGLARPWGDAVGSGPPRRGDRAAAAGRSPAARLGRVLVQPRGSRAVRHERERFPLGPRGLRAAQGSRPRRGLAAARAAALLDAALARASPVVRPPIVQAARAFLGVRAARRSEERPGSARLPVGPVVQMVRTAGS